MTQTTTTQAKVTDIDMEWTDAGWIAHCTVGSVAPTLVLGKFSAGPVNEPEALPEAIKAGLAKFAAGLVGSVIPSQH